MSPGGGCSPNYQNSEEGRLNRTVGRESGCQSRTQRSGQRLELKPRYGESEKGQHEGPPDLASVRTGPSCKSDVSPNPDAREGQYER